MGWDIINSIVIVIIVIWDSLGIYIYMGAVLNLSSFLRYFIHLALALAPSCASQGFSAK